MHSMLVFMSGMLLLAIIYMVARSRGISIPRAAMGFIGLWLVVIAVNMWVGIYQAGYSFMDELPISLVLFVIPALCAFVIAREART